MGFVHKFGSSAMELTLGGRQQIYLLEFEQFLIKLREAGATLAFFCDGQLQTDKSDEWCHRRDAEFHDTYQMISQNGATSKRRFGCKTIVKSLMKTVEDKRYGHIVVSTQVDCDAAIAKYAVANNALAVVANDSDFVIFEGNFQWWEASSMSLRQMKAFRFERLKLREMFALNNKQMKYFATIAGNDFTKDIPMRKWMNFEKIATFCRSLRSDRSEDRIHKDIAKFMQIDHRQIDAIATSIKSYDINFTVEPIGMPIDEYAARNVLIHAFRSAKIFQYEANFLDFEQRNNNNKNNYNKNNNNAHFDTILDIFIDVFRKLGGILLKERAHENPLLKIVTKYSLHEKYTLKQHTPIYPNGKPFSKSIFT